MCSLSFLHSVVFCNGFAFTAQRAITHLTEGPPGFPGPTWHHRRYYDVLVYGGVGSGDGWWSGAHGGVKVTDSAL